MNSSQVVHALFLFVLLLTIVSACVWCSHCVPEVLISGCREGEMCFDESIWSNVGAMATGLPRVLHVSQAAKQTREGRAEDTEAEK